MVSFPTGRGVHEAVQEGMGPVVVGVIIGSHLVMKVVVSGEVVGVVAVVGGQEPAAVVVAVVGQVGGREPVEVIG